MSPDSPMRRCSTEVQLLSFVCCTGGRGSKPRLWNIQNLGVVPPYSAVGDSITLDKLGRIPALAEWGSVPQLDIPYYIICKAEKCGHPDNLNFKLRLEGRGIYCDCR